MAKRILCFGDSYTWGYVPGTKYERFPENVRFPKVLQKLLGKNFEVIEEGLNSRTLVSEDVRPNKEGRNGSQYLIPCLDTHDPLDLVIFMLGTNELKSVYKNTPKQIGTLFEKYFVKVTLHRKSQSLEKYPKVLIVSLPIINENKKYAADRYAGQTDKFQKMNKIYADIAKTNKCLFVDASELEVGEDGVHLTKDGHLELAKELYREIKRAKLE